MAGGSCIGDDKPCSCITYEEELVNDRRRCLECHHGKSRHCGTPIASLPNALIPSTTNSVTLGSKLSMLHELTRRPSSTSLAVSIKPVSKEDARAEALKGFRPKTEVIFLNLLNQLSTG